MARHRFLTIVASLFTLAAVAAPTFAQSDWPKRPIRVILPSGPGGTSDIFMRLLSDNVSKTLGQPVVVDNKPGAGGTLAATLVAQAEPDGYTLMMNSVATHAIGPAMYKLKFDPEKNVTAVARLAYVANILYVRKDSPFKNVRELITYAKANPGKLNYASSGAGTSVHLAAVEMSLLSGLDMVHIPYNGAAPSMQAVLSGDAAFSFENSMSIMGQIRGGSVVPLAVTTSRRIPQLANVPTMIESGAQGFDISTWFGIVAPGGTPKPIVDKVAAAFEHALKDPQIADQINKLGADPQFMPPAEFHAYMTSERQKWAAIVKASGATVN